MKNGEEGPTELMDSLEQDHQFACGMSPKGALSFLLSSSGCSKGYSSTEQSLWSLMAHILTEAASYEAKSSPLPAAHREMGWLQGA